MKEIISFTQNQFTILLLLIVISIGTYNANANENRVIATLGNDKITFGQIEKAFGKNLLRKDKKIYEISNDSLLNFVNLYLNYRLKVLDAKERGFADDPSVLDEIQNNRKALAESFYYDNVMVKPEVDRMVKGRKYEYKIAMIMTTTRSGDERDSVQAWKNINSAKQRLDSGEDFASVAQELSWDREIAKNGGVIDTYITTAKVQRPIELAIEQTEPGNIYPDIIETHWGYFMVKVLEKKEREFINIQHILLTFSQDKDTAAVLKQADEILKKLKAGEKFETLAEKYSEDENSRDNGGFLGEYYSRSTGLEHSGTELLIPFQEAAFKLKDGQISDKVITDFGVHIIKRVSSKPVDFDKEREELRSFYRRTLYNEDKRATIMSMLNKYGFEIYEENLKQFLSKLDTNASNINPTWSEEVSSEIKKLPLYTIDKQTYNVETFIEKVNKDPILRGFATNLDGIKQNIIRYAEAIAFENETKNLEVDYPEFKTLMNEFRDGILLFRVEALEVWDNLKFDTVAAMQYYEETKTQYRTKTQYDLTEIYIMTEEVANDIINNYNNGMDFEELAQINTLRAGFRQKKGNWGLVSPDNNELAKAVSALNPKKGTIVGPIPFEQGFSLVKVNDVKLERQKTFEEAIPDFAPAFQELQQKKITNKWLESLRKKYNAKVNEKELNLALQELKKQVKK